MSDASSAVVGGVAGGRSAECAGRYANGRRGYCAVGAGQHKSGCEKEGKGVAAGVEPSSACADSALGALSGGAFGQG